MITIKDVLDKSETYLIDKGMKRARREAEEVLSVALHKPRIDLYMEFDRPLSPEELERARHILRRRGQFEPIQYIQGEVSFFNSTIKVDSSVLIPRQETELLIEKIVSTLRKEPLKNKVLWDLCTGSGAIAIALKKALPELTVIASDLSDAALKLAEQNAQDNSVDILFKKGDLFKAFESQKIDYLVSNPPYISEEQYLTLESEVKDFEPKMSLVSGVSGLEIYQRIAGELKHILNSPGKAWFEIGDTQKKSIQEIFETAGFDNLGFEMDLSGKDRFFFLELE